MMPKNMEMALLFDFYGDMLTEKQRDVFDLYYDNDLSLAEIAENEGITRQGVRDSIKRAENQLLDMEARLGLVERFRRIQGDVAAIRQSAREIAEINERHGFSREIDTHARHIDELAVRLENT